MDIDVPEVWLVLSLLAVGVLSLALVLLAELALSPFVRGSVQAWFDSFTPAYSGAQRRALDCARPNALDCEALGVPDE